MFDVLPITTEKRRTASIPLTTKMLMNREPGRTTFQGNIGATK